MQKLQDSIFSIVKTTNLSSAVFSFLQPTEEFSDKTPLGGILSDTKHGWLALGPKFCVVDLKTGLKVAAKVFGSTLSNSNTVVTSVTELPTPLTENSQQLIISLDCEDIGLICVFHINGSQILRCIQTDVIVTNLSVSDEIPDGPLACFDGVITAGSKTGEIFVLDLNRAALIQALKNISQGKDNLVRNEENMASVTFLPLKVIQHIEEQRYHALENDDHIAILLNDNALIDGQYIFRNPDGSVRMKSKRDHIRVSSIQYIPQIGSLAVGFNFGAFQIWNLMDLNLEFTSQVNIECLPVTHFGFQEPCDDPRAFCYLWVLFSVIDSFEEEEFPLAVMYSLTYRGKRMSNTKFLYQDFSSAAVVFEVELNTIDKQSHLVGGRCISCHSYSIHSTLGDEGEDSLINICQLVWECWGEGGNTPPEYGMLLFDLDQWYKAQMPATFGLTSNAFMSATWCTQVGHALDVRLQPGSVSPYSHATKLEEHFYPNSLHYNCVCLNTSEASILNTVGIQRQIISSMDEVGPTILLNPPRLYKACVAAGLTPLYMDPYARSISQEYQRKYLLSVALEARLSRFLKRCAHDWATGSHAGAGCTLTFLVDWCWQRAIELKENAKELTAPLFSSSSLPDKNVVRCLEHCVQQLTQLTGLLDAVLTKCCNLVVPDALSEMEEKYKGIGCVSLYFQVVQWFLRVGLLPERHLSPAAVTYPAQQLYASYNKRRVKLQRLQESPSLENRSGNKSCALLYIDQLIEQEFGGDRIHQIWINGGSECNGLYPPPSLYSLLRLYLLPDIAEEHKHSLVLYLLVDYSMVYDEMRYESVIRRLMQFPTMFGLSNTAIKATQAFWHLDHRDFDFALDQLQCLTGNTLSEWQHNVVLSALLAQRKTQAALQYLHVRKPAPIQNIPQNDDVNCSNNKVNDYDKLDDWQSCCNLYLARELVFEALDVIRICVQNASTSEDKKHVLNFFFKGCRSAGQLAKILQVSLSPFEEDVFIRYLEECNEPQTSDLLIMYYLEQARYLEAQHYNAKLKQSRGKKDMCISAESLLESVDRDNARDTIVEVMCSALPDITSTVAHCVLDEKDFKTRVVAPKPMSVYIQATSPKNTFTYKSSFIQDTIENASEIWINKPKTRRGLRRAHDIEDTPFICTPKLTRHKSSFGDRSTTGGTPPKRAKFDPKATPRTPKVKTTLNVSQVLSEQISLLLDMPDTQTPECKLYERSGAETPHSILKTRSRRDSRETASPVDSRYLGDSDDEILETTSNHTHYSDAAKHLRFAMPTASESGSTPSPVEYQSFKDTGEKDISESVYEKEIDDSYHTTASNLEEMSSLESPRETKDMSKVKKQYKDTVRARLSLSNNSSLSDDPNASIESIADIPITVINPRYSKSMTRPHTDNTDMEEGQGAEVEMEYGNRRIERISPIMPKSRRGLRDVRSDVRRSITPERQDSPIATHSRSTRITRSRSRSRTPEVSPLGAVLSPIKEQPVQEVISEPHPKTSLLSAPRQLRSRSRTPERSKVVSESPKLDSIEESPIKSPMIESPRRRRPLRSRSATPEMEVVTENEPPVTPRSLRSRSKTPENLMSPKAERFVKGKKSLSRIVLEANTFAKTKQTDKPETEDEPIEKLSSQIGSNRIIGCTPTKPSKEAPNFMDLTFSPIVNKSVLQSSTENELSETVDKSKSVQNTSDFKSVPVFTTIHESYFDKSVLHSYESTVGESSSVTQEVSMAKETVHVDKIDLVSMKSVKDVSSLLTSDSDFELKDDELKTGNNNASEIQKEKESTVEREIKEDASNEENSSSSDDVIVINKSPEGYVSEEEQESVSNEELIISLDDDMFSDNSSDKLEIHEQTSSDSDDQSVSPAPSATFAEIHFDEHIEETVIDTNVDSNETKTDKNIVESEVIESVEIPFGETEVCSEDIIGLDTNKSTDEILKTEDPINVENMGNDPITKKTDDADEATMVIQTTIEINEDVEINVDPWIQGNFSLLTDDNSVLSDRSDLKLNYSEEKLSENDDIIEIQEIEDDAWLGDSTIPQTIDVVDSFTNPSVETQVPEQLSKPNKASEDMQMSEAHTDVKIQTSVGKTQITEESRIIERSKEMENLAFQVEGTPKISEADFIKNISNVVEQASHTKNLAKTDKNEKPSSQTSKYESINPTDSSEKTEQSDQLTQAETSKKSNIEQMEYSSEEVLETNKPSRRKRGKSISSNKSNISIKSRMSETVQAEEKDASITPVSRKRNVSIAKVEEEKTPGNKTIESGTPKKRVRTPSIEGRKIITRLASKELSDNESNISLEDVLTPKRRSLRSAKSFDDNALASPAKLDKSKGDDNSKLAQARRRRKSTVATKSELSVIPENAPVDVSEPDEDVQECVKSTRKPTVVPKTSTTSNASCISIASTASPDSSFDEKDTTPPSPFNVQPIDRISLLNKSDFEGPPDTEELHNRAASPDSLTSEVNRTPLRATRARSEARTTVRPAKVASRRMSEDIVNTSKLGSPGPESSPIRLRRASFNRACEALHTPKGRRASTDLRRGDSDSVQGSPSNAEARPGTPVRRTRKTSTQSNTSQGRPASSKKSKKTSP